MTTKIKCKNCLFGMLSKYGPRQQCRADNDSLNEVLECICFGQFRAAQLERNCEEFIDASEKPPRQPEFDPDIDRWTTPAKYDSFVVDGEKP